MKCLISKLAKGFGFGLCVNVCGCGQGGGGNYRHHVPTTCLTGLSLMAMGGSTGAAIGPAIQRDQAPYTPESAPSRVTLSMARLP